MENLYIKKPLPEIKVVRLSQVCTTSGSSPSK